VAELIAKGPLAGLLPLSIGGVGLTGVDPGLMFSLQPFAGKAAALSKALKKAHGVEFPGPGESQSAKGVRVLWSGREQAFLLGAAPDPALTPFAAVTDQSDGWAMMALQGPGAEDVLARLCPLDLRLVAFPVGRVARSQLQHVAALICRVDDGFQIMVMRSFATTAVHELETAMKGVSARKEP
jgi:heterotetrameric sarcosine oxidase gamma subunit